MENKIDENQKNLFRFTGNPIIDNGMSVLSIIAKKEKLEDIRPKDIKENLGSFFESIKYQFNDLDATKSEQKHSKKKLKQHLISLYTTNHYLHGINNYLCSGYNITISSKDCIEISKRLPDQIEIYEVTKSEIKKNKFDVNLTSILQIKETSEEAIQDLISEFTVGITCKYKTKALVKKKVETNEDYFTSFKDEVLQILEGKSKILYDINRVNKNNLCNFCGKHSDIILTKDIYPLTSALGDFNLGVVFICRICYLATLFSFFNYVNLKKEEKKSGVYFFYHFSSPEVMIEYSRQQISYLQNETLASLQTKVGGKYSIVFDHLYEKIKTLNSIERYRPSVTIYVLLNDNREAIYENIVLPNGLLNFWLLLNNANYADQWSLIHKNLNCKDDYLRFVDGTLPISKLKKNKREVVKAYLKEVALMKEELIVVCEKLSESLSEYFKKVHEKNPSRRDHWTEEFYDFFNVKKAHELFNNLFTMNNDYFKWTKGGNLFSVSEAKLLLEEFKLFNLFYSLIEYFILNSLNEIDKEQYFKYIDKKSNI
ncbi:MAG: hypothetical protein K8F52_08785 [Candidatus Scalindua rubra]|nr:hypothetical protein [Candidatus Scalindua rubra]TWU36461.1 hypothetical protein S225a_07400 [Candidatus Brocadiaceae bacterium S225]